MTFGDRPKPGIVCKLHEQLPARRHLPVTLVRDRELSSPRAWPVGFPDEVPPPGAGLSLQPPAQVRGPDAPQIDLADSRLQGPEQLFGIGRVPLRCIVRLDPSPEFRPESLDGGHLCSLRAIVDPSLHAIGTPSP